MNVSNFFIDTNIALYLLAGDDTVAQLLNGKTLFVSFITELELLGYKETILEEAKRIEIF